MPRNTPAAKYLICKTTPAVVYEALECLGGNGYVEEWPLARVYREAGQVIDPHYVAMMNAMMQETLLSGTAHKAELPGWMAAGKTGTSQDFRDAWFIGYTSRLVTGIWLGNDDNTPTKKATGGGLPVEIWSRFMKVAHQGVAPAPLPGLSGGNLLASPQVQLRRAGNRLRLSR